MSEVEASGLMGMEVTGVGVGVGQGVEVFKKPLFPAPHRKRKVLDEESYIRVSRRW